MSPQDVARYAKVIIPTIALFGGGFTGTALYADGKPTRSEVKEMIENAPPIIRLEESVKHIKDDVAENREENREQFQSVMRAIEKSR